MGTKSIRHICEAVVVSYLQGKSELSGLQINPGDTATLKDLPTVAVICDNAAPPGELPEGLGNFDCSVEVCVYSSADAPATLAQHRDRCALIEGFLGWGSLADLKAAFAASGDATLYDVTPEPIQDERQSRMFGSRIPYTFRVVLPA
jgi:hypothetical protein